MGKIRISLALAALVATAFAAPDPAKAAAVGVVLGFNRGSISGDAPPDAGYGTQFGLLAGVQGEIGIASDIFLSLQPMYVRRGARISFAEVNSGAGQDSLSLALDYFAVPVVVKFRAAGGRTYFLGGLDIAFLTAATLSGGGSDVDVKDSFQSTDVGALLGFGVLFPIGRPRLTVELRYVQGLVNLAGDSEGEPISALPDRFHSSGLQCTAGLLFPLGRP